MRGEEGRESGGGTEKRRKPTRVAWNQFYGTVLVAQQILTNADTNKIEITIIVAYVSNPNNAVL